MTNRFDIHSIIAKGKESVRPYQLPAGEVLIRPLSELEMEECELAMLDEIKDPEVRAFVLNANQEEFADPEAKEAEFKNKDMNYSQFFRAANNFLLNIAYLAMKDFTDDFTRDDLKRIDGIRALAAEVQRISGYNKETTAAIEEFREQ